MAGVMIDIASGPRPLRGYLSQTEPGPGVIVLQEWWGLVDHIKDVTDRFAREGFVALAPDLYQGKTAKSPDEAGKLMMALDIAKTEADLAAAAERLAHEPWVQGRRLGIVGFCMGGQLALYAATRNRRIGAVVDFYGIHREAKPDFAALRAPVLGFFGGKDGSVTPERVAELERALAAAGVAHDLIVYPEAQHAFFNDTRPEVYDARLADLAWTQMLRFFRRHL